MQAPMSPPRDERDLLGQLETELTRQFGGRIADEEIQQTATDSLRRFDRARIKDYVLILALRAGRLRLRSLASVPA
jgi:hypothetical protein